MKKYRNIAWVILSLGILLIVIALVLAKSNNKPSDSNSNLNINLDELKTNYSYVKTQDINKKTRVKFPIYNGQTADMYVHNEYNRMYTDEERQLYIVAAIINNNDTLEKFYDNLSKNYQEALKEEGIEAKSSDVECNYLCKKVDWIKDDKIVEERIDIYIKTSDTDIAIITYYLKEKTFQEELIKALVANISIDYEAKYTIGRKEDDKLIIELEETKEKQKIKFSLNSDTYEEVESGNNTSNVTTINNKIENQNITLKMYYGHMSDTILEDVELYYGYTKEKNSKEEVEFNNKVFNLYYINNQFIYAYEINDDNVLLIEMDKDNKSIINDLSQFTIN